MTATRLRAPSLALTFAGQSLNGNPTGANSYPARLLALRPAARYDAWIDGFPWSTLIARTSHLIQGAKAGLVTGALMVGGTSDVNFARTGVQIYADMVTYANAARALGFGFVVASTITPSTNFAGQELVEWADGNSRILGDASGAFDAVADLAIDPRLDDATDLTYYADGTHPTNTGAIAIAELMDAAIAEALV